MKLNQIKHTLLPMLFVCAVAAVTTITTTKTAIANTAEEANFAASTQIYLDSLPGASWSNEPFHGAVLLTRDGKAIFEYDDSGVKQATYEIGSTTKLMVATAIMQLVEQGKLSLTQSVGSLLPRFAEQYPDVTIIHLLSHSSGISEYVTSELLKRGSAFSRQEIRQIISDQQKTMPAGLEHEYSNTNYLLLGLIIEKLSGLTWQQYLKQNVFQPSGMLHISTKPATAPLYYLEQDKLIAGDPVNASLAFSAGALTASPQDLMAFYKAFTSDQLLSSSSRKLMSQEVAPGSDYGLGVMLENASIKDQKIRYMGHGGSTPTSSSHFVFDDINRCALVIFQTPSKAFDLYRVQKTLLNACQSGVAPKALAKKETIVLSDEYRTQLPGDYLMEAKVLEIVKSQLSVELAEQIKTLQVRLENNQLIFDFVGQEAFPVEPMSDGTLQFKSAKVTIVPRKEDGKITGFIFKQPRVGLPYIKTKPLLLK
ncbi:serine hydrolase domain-containing protein [Pelagibaculum spongiae]|nr:serine hydrolase domain-containing protein [Pelagibaculum spongiae]